MSDYSFSTGEGVISSIGVDGTGYKQYKTGPGLLISFTHTENILLWVTLDKGKGGSTLFSDILHKIVELGVFLLFFFSINLFSVACGI